MKKTAAEKRKQFRDQMNSGKIMIAPSVYDALSAKLAEAAGMNCLAMGGYAVEASRLGQPDVGLLSLTEMTATLKNICDATNIPVVGDGDTGYGNALNVIRTVEEFEKAGAACIFLEDQVWPKRCGHMEGKQVISAEEHAEKIRAAYNAREDKNFVIMARTDSRAIYGLDDAIERGKRYADAGAEMLFVEALRTREELEKVARAFEGTGVHMVGNMIEGGKTPIVNAYELEQMGFSLVFWACAPLYLVSKTLLDAFTVLKEKGDMESIRDKMIDFFKFNQFIGLDEYKKLEREYNVDRDD